MILPFVLSHASPELKQTWPDMPWFVRKVLVPYKFSRKYAGYEHPFFIMHSN
jgi:hypothetical protein